MFANEFSMYHTYPKYFVSAIYVELWCPPLENGVNIFGAFLMFLTYFVVLNTDTVEQL